MYKSSTVKCSLNNSFVANMSRANCSEFKVMLCFKLFCKENFKTAHGSEPHLLRMFSTVKRHEKLA